MKLGFTGTRKGMTQHQKLRFTQLLLELNPNEFHHGDCVGSDEQAHGIVKKALPKCKIVIHPASNMFNNQRAFCSGTVVLEPDQPLKRNRVIVESVGFLVAAPKSVVQERRSGTWATIRYARQRDLPTLVLWPKAPH